MQHYDLGCTSDKIWNLPELIKFLAHNQHQHIQIRIDPEAICLANVGLYDILDCFQFERVDLRTFNPLEHHEVYNVYKKDLDFWFAQTIDIDVNLHAWTKNKKFMCLFGRPTASRLGLGAYLYRHYKDLCHLHFSATTQVDNLPQFELDKLLEYNIKSIEDAGMLINHLPLLLESSENYTWCRGYDYNDKLTAYYKDILIDVVVESHVAGDTFFPTEKTARPMWLKKPFVMFGSRNYLEYLRQMGFKTFDKFWNEEYDGFEGPDRFKRLLLLIDDLAQRSVEQLNQMYQDMQPILEHNYQLLLNKSYNKQITKIL